MFFIKFQEPVEFGKFSAKCRTIVCNLHHPVDLLVYDISLLFVENDIALKKKKRINFESNPGNVTSPPYILNAMSERASKKQKETVIIGGVKTILLCKLICLEGNQRNENISVIPRVPCEMQMGLQPVSFCFSEWKIRFMILRSLCLPDEYLNSRLVRSLPRFQEM